MRMFVIPSHRVCFSAIESIKREIDYFQQQGNESAIFVLLDNGQSGNFQKNHQFLKNCPFPCPKYHLGIKELKLITNAISSELNADLTSFLIPYETNYGKIANFIYLLALLFKANGIHRRDSDCQLLELTDQEMPIYQEARFLGKKVAEMKKDLAVDEELIYPAEEKICLVGSGYLGDWDLDLGDIVAKNPDALKYLMKICNIEETMIEADYDDKYGEEANVQVEKPILTSIFTPSHALECGNTSLSEVYKYLPNFIGTNGVGFDYHTNFVAFNCKVPMVYHFNKIYHLHDKARHQDIKPLHYWAGIIKMVDFDDYHYNLILKDDFSKLCQGRYGLKVIQEIAPKILPDLLQERFAELDSQKRSQNIDEITQKILIESTIPEYIKIGQLLAAKKEQLLAQLDQEYTQSIALQIKWPAIVAALAALDVHQLLKPLTI